MNKKQGESRVSESTIEHDPERSLIWDGITKSEMMEEGARVRHELADLCKQYRWAKVLQLLSEWPQLVNATRPDGHARYTPLHQAAHGGASVEVVDGLLQYGAFRTLKDSHGQRAVDIARARSHAHLLQILEPVYRHQVPGTVLAGIQENFHAVIHERAHRLVEEHKLRLPELDPLLEFRDRKFWFAVPGMYGGFSYWLGNDGPNAKLITESWCRVCGGSGQRHEITSEGSALVEEGFV